MYVSEEFSSEKCIQTLQFNLLSCTSSLSGLRIRKGEADSKLVGPTFFGLRLYVAAACHPQPRVTGFKRETMLQLYADRLLVGCRSMALGDGTAWGSGECHRAGQHHD